MRQCRKIAGLDRHIFGNLLGSAISWRAKNAIDPGGLLQFPSQRVLTAAAANDENFHGTESSLGNEFKASKPKGHVELIHRDYHDWFLGP
jgi:hypothetical protein